MQHSDHIANEIEAVKNADSLGETKFSKLFHEARTSSPKHYSGVTVQVRVTDDGVEVHDTPVKTREGKTLRGTDAWDAKVSLRVQPFMSTTNAKEDLIWKLNSWHQSQLEKEHQERQRKQFA